MLEAPPLSLYVHLPWCVSKCPYCDFNSHAAGDSPPTEAYADALLSDLETELALVWGRSVQSIYFGGGTPSLFPAGEIGRLLSGINRVSLGVQSFDGAALKALGRIHGPEEALAAVDALRSAGLENFNLDLMFGLPGQDLAAAVEDVRTAIACRPAHPTRRLNPGIAHSYESSAVYDPLGEPGRSVDRTPVSLPVDDRAEHGVLGAAAPAAGPGLGLGDAGGLRSVARGRRVRAVRGIRMGYTRSRVPP